jgi:hypothetical protein
MEQAIAYEYKPEKKFGQISGNFGPTRATIAQENSLVGLRTQEYCRNCF